MSKQSDTSFWNRWLHAENRNGRRQLTKQRSKSGCFPLSRRLRFEPLEDRQLLAIFTVDTLGDVSAIDGLTTLREAINLANGSSGADTITFAPSLTAGGPVSIILTQGELAVSEAAAIDGPSPALIFINALHQFRVINITAPTGDFTISGLTITGGKTTGNNLNLDDTTFGGGAIRSITSGNLTLHRVNVMMNETSGEYADGGGIFAAGNVTLTNSFVGQNSTVGFRAEGGSIRGGNNVTLIDSTVSQSSTAFSLAYGGGIRAEYNVTLLNSTVSGNSTAGTGSSGGGIHTFLGLVTLVNSTVSGNSTSGGQAFGGGIHAPVVSIAHSTITGNSTTGALSDGGGIHINGGDLTVTNSILAGNTSPANPDLKPGFSGRITVNHSLIGNTSGLESFQLSMINSGVGNILNQNPQLGPLANNIGPTQTHALLPTSPAINTGDPSAVAGQGGVPLGDQRGELFGFPRIVGGLIDMGSFEFDAFASFTVNTLVDENDGVGVGGVSLRDAVGAVNAAAGPGLINFSPALNGGTIDLSSLGQITIARSVTIAGPGTGLLTVRAYDPVPATKTGNGSRIFNIDNVNGQLDIAAIISGLTLTGGDVTGSGGAILSTENLSLYDVLINDSYANLNGGGIRHAFGVLNVSGSTIANNRAEQNGGGLQIDTANAYAAITRSTVRDNRSTIDGAGLNNLGAKLVVAHSAVYGNIATDDGGGIKSDTNLTGSQYTTILNTTVSGNQSGNRGGGIFNVDGVTEIRHSTVALNSAPTGGGVASFGDNNTLTRAYSSILTSNTNGDAQFVTGVANNSFESFGFNRVTAGNALGDFNQGGDLTGVAVALAPLGDNGGPTLTHALPPASIAIDAGESTSFPLFTMYDQRGEPFPRVYDGDNSGTARIDIGAFEYIPSDAVSALFGDYNRDKVVDAADHVVWRKALGTSVTPYTGADGDGDGNVSQVDHGVWAANFGRTLPPAAAGSSAAEPAFDDLAGVAVAQTQPASNSTSSDAPLDGEPKTGVALPASDTARRVPVSRQFQRRHDTPVAASVDDHLLFLLAVDRARHFPRHDFSVSDDSRIEPSDADSGDRPSRSEPLRVHWSAISGSHARK